MTQLFLDLPYFIMKVKTVGTKVLKENLSDYLRLVKEGETILVMERNRVVAEIKKTRTERLKTFYKEKKTSFKG
ncbi:toxin-antitoxin system, antitoxin component, PHD domain protein [Leptospira noguchii str. 2006001870]|uniref:Toxin-antitoxin system, antitoxin component, PHD domain protein n=1 Tax=Leptospira noguchii serovar Autumnalis str. ZUN142 TaxID=1085540 RepID=M6U6D4_9LEPT|nr:toxin-antitoxin system, antitoxin component, PHD domain protein [Leptospira noguchii str. 2006001870]EMO40040.1 toxin-antitoxin system, antitoxin component, PHD domain protein [Leptospira noguchii serovar Autumnalis str. ZUN142]